MSVLELSLVAAAVLIGLTGAWSPCGFSMVETVGIAGDGGRRRTTIAACATFLPGALIGGVVTFGSLAALGEAIHGAGGRLAYVLAAAIAIAAAAAEARGLRIVPQIRRQLPEAWRWTMPLPLASALYGILLGLGFTTFVLSFGVWALAGISIALGDPRTGLLIGAAFGVGRALPVLAVAPAVDTRLGIRCIELMAERPALYRAFRLGDAFTLGLVAAALTATTATAARTDVRNGYDPSASGRTLAFQRADRDGAVRFRGEVHTLPGRDPAAGGPYLAVTADGNKIRILNRVSSEQIGWVPAPNAESLAISRGRPSTSPWSKVATSSARAGLTIPPIPARSKGSPPSRAPHRPRSSQPRRRPARVLGLEAQGELDQAAQPETRGAHGRCFAPEPTSY